MHTLQILRFFGILSLGSVSCMPNGAPKPTQTETQPANPIKPNKLRQEEGGLEGIGGEFTGEVGEQIGQIINGVFTGNVGDIFGGTLPFIEDEDVQTGVGTIFDTLTVPLNNLWASGTQQGLKYFGIGQTTPNPLNATVNGTAVPAKQQLPQIITVIATTEPTDEDNENDSRKLNN